MAEKKKPAKAITAKQAKAAGEAIKKGMKKEKKSGSLGKIKIFFFIIVALVLFRFLFPTALILLGMLPTLVALITDDDREKSRATTIGMMNFAGVAPFILELWQKGEGLDVALGIIHQPFNWLIMFGAAAVGQLILYAVPTAAIALTINNMETRLKRLNENAKIMQEIYGPDVANTKPLSEIKRME